ncbi:MAG TPA: LacI family DNA-binding transcriptional regulator [Devosiaceae bacterium]|jgi:DNA-binding LacI/PurR family transcriptional regulator|nr:LacI family DNA-binding transcriptional regulator [Devosiaceae bacterium]
MTSIAQVAERAGVSRTTVSHVINHAERVSKPLRERVLVAIDELGYVPNRQAQSLRTGRTNLIAVLIPDILNPFYPELVKVIQTELEQAELDMLIFNTDVPGGHSVEHGREYLRQIQSKRIDGLIIADFAVHWMLEDLEHLKTPTVFMGHLPRPSVDSVGFDDHGGCYEMGRYLARRGHRRIAHVTGPSFFQQAEIRRNAFELALAEHGAPQDPALRFEGSYLVPSGYEAIEWLLRTHRRNMPTAIFFANSLMARGGLAALHDHGLESPRDIALATFDDFDHLDYVRPKLTRVGGKPALLAMRAMEMLRDRLDGRWIGQVRSETLPCTLREFDTA